MLPLAGEVSVTVTPGVGVGTGVGAGVGLGAGLPTKTSLRSAAVADAAGKPVLLSPNACIIRRRIALWSTVVVD